MNFLTDLNPMQQQAVKAINGPVLVVAGAGSGKTKVLTYRIAYLIEQGIAPQNILAVTFTNKAAEEMRQRVIKLISAMATLHPRGGATQEYRIGISALRQNIGTFHSICARILRHEISALGYKPNFTIYDDSDQNDLIKHLTKEANLDKQQFKSGMIREIISSAKDELLDPNQFREKAKNYIEETISQIYQAYQARLKMANSLDFDDLIFLTVKLFQFKPEVLARYQNYWQYILVDEYQDTNHSQYTLLNLLAQKNHNICAVGDIDQSIYRWRGADFRNILNFEQDYPNTQIILMEQNYRSSQNILAAANEIIKQNNQRKEKNLWTENPAGPKITAVQLTDQKQEGQFVADEILSQREEKRELRLSDFVVLYRTNAQSRALEEAFLNHNIPYKIIGGIKFYQRKEVKDLLAYLRLIHNPDDLASIQRIANVPPRGLVLRGFQLDAFKKWPQAKQNRWNQFQALMSGLRQQSQKLVVSELIKTILTQTNYKNYIDDGSQEAKNRLENIQEFIGVASRHDQQAPTEGLNNFLQEVGLLSDTDNIDRGQDAVHLMTLHCAKGLEFPVVFITGCEEGIFPHSRSLINPEELEEERRLCYVGLTRAQKRAYFTFVRQRLLWGSMLANLPSRFLSDIPAELVDWHRLDDDDDFDVSF